MVEEHASGKNIVDHLKTGYSISPANSSLLTALACRTINEESATVTKLLEEAIWFDRFNSPGTRAFAQLLLAQHYERLGMYAKAKTVLQRLQNDPDVALAGQARMALARSLIGAGERQAAIALLRRSAKVTPTLEERLLLVEALLARSATYVSYRS
jgi:tetratricopeptide (TPR) repeat protein